MGWVGLGCVVWEVEGRERGIGDRDRVGNGLSMKVWERNISEKSIHERD